jgi:hypothetical protein
MTENLQHTEQESEQVPGGASGDSSPGHRIVPVWFFVGVLLLIYGLMILASGLAEWSHPPETVLANLHAPVWWGGLLVVLGGAYCLIFRPNQRS